MEVPSTLFDRAGAIQCPNEYESVSCILISNGTLHLPTAKNVTNFWANARFVLRQERCHNHHFNQNVQVALPDFPVTYDTLLDSHAHTGEAQSKSKEHHMSTSLLQKESTCSFRVAKTAKLLMAIFSPSCGISVAVRGVFDASLVHPL